MLLRLPLFLTIPWVWFFLGFYWEPDPFGTRTTRWLAGILAVSLSFRVVFQVLALWGAVHTVHPVRDAGSVVWKMSILSPWFAAPGTTVSLFHSLALIVLMLTIARGPRTQMRWNAFKMSRVG